MKHKGGRPKHKDTKYGGDNVDVMTPEEVAKLLRVHRHTIWRMIKDKTIPAFKVGQQYRIMRTDLEKLKL